MTKKTPPRITNFPAAKQRRMDQLLAKNREGKISQRERAALTRLVAEAERLMADNARHLEAFAREERAHAPAGAIPVTVWVMPQPTER